MQLSLGEYIFRRLRELGVRNIFGVPGDFNLNLLDWIDHVEGMKWVGTCNELNAAYAADGYARCRELPGVVITTYGVGELSAINGIGGAYAESVPIIHIVGMTARSAQKARLMIHHTLGEGLDHAIYQSVSKPLSAATEFLWEDGSFTQQVDRVIEASFKTKLPVYLYIPIDTPDILVDGSRLDKPLDLTISNPGRESEEQEVVDQIVSAIEKAEHPCFLVDLYTQRFGATKDLRDIVESTQIPAFTTPLGKSAIDETSANFGGTYIGAFTHLPDVREAIEGADLVIHVGTFPADSNSGGFSQNLASKGTLAKLHAHYVSLGDKKWEGLNFAPVVKKLRQRLQSQKLTVKNPAWFKHDAEQLRKLPQGLSGPLKQKYLWQCFNTFLKPDDFVIGEVGTSQFGTAAILSLPKNGGYYTQIFYSCIGFTVGATLGTLVARRELGHTGRTILFVGDGSLQMTVQDISTMIRNGFAPTIVILNNDGYTVERVIHGPAREYNDIARWDYSSLLKFFGASKESKHHLAKTYEELLAVLSDSEFQASKHPQVLEVVLDKYDSPQAMSNLVDTVLGKGKAAMQQDDKKNNRSRKVLDGTLTESGLSTA